jgi:hypothetical protein
MYKYQLWSLILIPIVGCSLGNGPDKDKSSPIPIDYCEKAKKVPASVKVGTGSTSFVDIDETSVLTPDTAGQGGHHIWTSVKATGLNPGQGEMIVQDSGIDGGYNYAATAVGDDPVLLTVEITFPDSTLGPYAVSYETFLDGNTENSSLSGITAILNVWAIMEHFEDQESVKASLFVSIKDSCGTIVTDRKEITIGLVGVPGLYGTGYG